jgi:1,4-dihydroxy-2-naphthoate octaprenyltransferase
MKEIIKLLRPHQYVKNLFVFAPLLFSFHFTSTQLVDTFVAFVLFCMIASSIYVLNDLMDIEEDKKHPKKCFRPLASSKVSKSTAKILILSLSLSALGIAYVVNQVLFSVLLLYFSLLNITEFLVPSICPETYSYTTDEIMQMGYPLIVFDLGAPAERVKNYELGKIISKENIIKELFK